MKQVSIILSGLTLLILVDGCMLNPARWVKVPKTVAVGKEKKENKLSVTPKQQAHRLLGLGMTFGALLLIGGIIIAIWTKWKKEGVLGAVSGVAVFIVSYALNRFLEPILIGITIALAGAVAYIIYVNWQMILSAVRFGEAMKKRAGVDQNEIHMIADSTIPADIQEKLGGVVKKVREE